MIWDWLVQLTGKYCSIRHIEYPEFETRIFGRMESTVLRTSSFTLYIYTYIIYLLNSKPRIMHFAYSDWFAQSWLSAHIP